MARTLRVEHAGAIHRVMNRGDRRKRIFVGDAAETGPEKGQGTILNFGGPEADTLPGSIIRKTVP